MSATARTLQRILRTRYPAFLFGGPLRSGEIPVFIYHDVEASAFTRDLIFLRHNGYRTLSLEEFQDQGGVARRPGEVLLTFDDARASVVRVALPLLREFEMRAALFVPTAWPGHELFMSWDEIRECRDSGVFDVESHAHRHALVHVSPRLIGFADLQKIARYDIYDWPMHGGRLGPPRPGTPVYEAAPLLSAERCYVESPELRQACVDFADAQGSELRELHDRLAARYPGRMMSAPELAALVESEFELSRGAFMQHLGKAPRVLAYPWMLGNAQSMECARASGITMTFGTGVDYGRAKEPYLPVKVFGRLRADWLRLLPGEGRATIGETFGRKIARFSSLHHLAH